MKFIPQTLKDVFVIEPAIYGDHRGYFMETYKKELFNHHIGPVEFIQDNESKSTYGVFRGLHYQKGEYAQAKLVRVLQGKVLDVIVDLRIASPTFGQSIAVELSDENHRQLFVPRGFAHGFIVLSEQAVFSYKVDNIYQPSAECCIRFDDPFLNLDLQVANTDLKLSEKDRAGLFFKDAPKF
ncbi:MAG: dTDP-4-dehydrorhamnose 3,5-epimerase [Bacteroidales bacterium]